MRELEKTRLTRDPWHGEWNYTLHPRTTPDDHDPPIKDLIQAEPLPRQQPLRPVAAAAGSRPLPCVLFGYADRSSIPCRWAAAFSMS